jgi:TPR repeat protein
VSQNNFKAAEKHCRQAYNIRKRLLGFNNEDTKALLDDIYGHLDMEENATGLYLEAAERGDYMAQIELARRYYGGIGVGQWTGTFGYSDSIE